MIVYILITAAYYLAAAFFLLTGWKNRDRALEEKEFISRPHTESLKGIAAVGIVVSHIASLFSKDVSGVTQLIIWAGTSLGGFGVDLFFFTSGYGNYFSSRNLERHGEKVRWLVKRTANILIVFLVCYGLTTAVLCLLGRPLVWKDVLRNIIDLKMPLSLTWYLKIQILLYAILTLSLFIRNAKVRAAALIGLSLALTLVCYLQGLPGQWWKSTMCFCLGYYAAAYKGAVCRFLNEHRAQAWWISLISFPVLFVVVNPVDSYFIKVIGNALLTVSVLIIIEQIRFDNAVMARIGAFSLEIYLTHIAFSAWFLKEHAPDDLRILYTLAVTVIVSTAAKMISRRISIR